MNGAGSLLDTLGHNGVEVCFANPGTSEMHFVAALDRDPRVRGVLGLFEGVVTGAADGYGRMADKPAATLLHLGPGMANGLAGLHNANRGRTPVVNIIGDHASYHRALDAPLTSDIEGAARPFSHWVRTSTSADSIASDAADAIANSLPGRISSLILPADTAWNTAEHYTGASTGARPTQPTIDDDVVTHTAAHLGGGGSRTAILMGGRSLRRTQLDLVTRIAEATGATVLSETFAARMERGAGIPAIGKVPYPVEPAVELLSHFDTIILIEAKPPVAFFAYPDKPSELTTPGTRFLTLCPVEGDSIRALQHLADTLTGTITLPDRARTPEFAVAGTPTGSIDPGKLGAWLSAAIPENAIVADESITTGRDFFPQTVSSRPHDLLAGTGGAIGWALPVAAGAAVAAPERKVIALESDGSAMYNIQSLWTYARESLDIVVVIFANRKYQILRNEMANVGVPDFGPKASALLDLDDPAIDFVSLAQGMGVPAARVETMEALQSSFDSALALPGPYLIEAAL